MKGHRRNTNSAKLNFPCSRFLVIAAIIDYGMHHFSYTYNLLITRPSDSTLYSVNQILYLLIKYFVDQALIGFRAGVLDSICIGEGTISPSIRV